MKKFAIAFSLLSVMGAAHADAALNPGEDIHIYRCKMYENDCMSKSRESQKRLGVIEAITTEYGDTLRNIHIIDMIPNFENEVMYITFSARGMTLEEAQAERVEAEALKKRMVSIDKQNTIEQQKLMDEQNEIVKKRADAIFKDAEHK
jgi:hypothetical protein